MLEWYAMTKSVILGKSVLGFWGHRHTVLSLGTVLENVAMVTKRSMDNAVRFSINMCRYIYITKDRLGTLSYDSTDERAPVPRVYSKPF